MAEENKLQVFPVGITEKEIKKIADQAIADSGAANEVPLATIADAGKVIKVGEDGKYELGEAGGGALYYHSIALGNTSFPMYPVGGFYSTSATPITTTEELDAKRLYMSNYVAIDPTNNIFSISQYGQSSGSREESDLKMHILKWDGSTFTDTPIDPDLIYDNVSQQ